MNSVALMPGQSEFAVKAQAAKPFEVIEQSFKLDELSGAEEHCCCSKEKHHDKSQERAAQYAAFFFMPSPHRGLAAGGKFLKC